MRRSVLACATVSVALLVAGGALGAVPGITRFMVKPGEETGFMAAKPRLARTIKAYVHGGSPKEVQSETIRLKASGFVEAAIENTDQIGGAGEGISGVIEFGSKKAARRELAHQLHSDIAAQGDSATIERFVVNGVPGSTGFSATVAAHPGGAANVLWREGRCVLIVGDFLPNGTPATLPAPVEAGALAVYRRTHGSCP